MKKFLIPLTALLMLGIISAKAETIYTVTAKEYADAMQEYAPHKEASLFSIGVQSDESQEILLAYYEGSLDERGALYDIYDEYSIHTLIYDSRTDADAAYEYYTSNGIAVCYNTELTVEASRPTTYAPYLSWGSGYVNTAWFTSQLELHFGSVGNMPEITVVEIDSGIDYNHPDLAGRIDTASGYDYYNNDNDPMDDNSHGTHVAGIIADNTLANVTIIPIKVTNAAGSFTSIELISALKLANELEPDIINMSIGTKEENLTLKEVFMPYFAKAYSNNTIICAAAGNGALNADNVFPAYMDNTITVANSTQTGGLSSTSNYGSVIELAAPGSNIDSTIPIVKGSYGRKSGTSMACPFVTAAVAMLRTYYTGIRYDNTYYTDITYDDALNILLKNVTPFSVATENNYGSGILNMEGLIPEAEPDPARTPEVSITPQPTDTPAPTDMPQPTDTPVPTDTPQPTEVPTAVPGDYDIAVNIDNPGNGSISITATRLIPDFCSLYAAQYDENGILVRLSKNSGETIIHLAEDTAYIKVFLWDNAHNNLPLTNVQTCFLTDSATGRR